MQRRVPKLASRITIRIYKAVNLAVRKTLQEDEGFALAFRCLFKRIVGKNDK